MQKAPDSPNQGSQLQRLQMLLDAARLLNSTLELKELTGIILAVVRAEVPVDRMSVFVVDRDRGKLQSLVTQEVEDVELSFPLDWGIAGAAASSGGILDIPDAYADPRFDPRFDGKLNYHTRDLFVLPVSNREGETVGVLELLNRSRPITAADREFLLGISVYIGLALENAWLHSQVVIREALERELAELRDRLSETERLSLMSEMFQGMVNEINNPLAFAMGYAELAKDQLGLPEKVRTYLEQIALGIDRTVAAAGKFQEFVEKREHERAPVNLGGALRQLSDLRAHEWDRRHIETALILETVPPVFAHEDQMRLVLLYLIKNAEDAVLQSASRELRIHLFSSQDHVRVEIHDTGSGAAPDFDSPLFRPLLNSNSGSSLGLAIASSIVRQHKGRIRSESERGKGTTVIVELPAHSQEPGSLSGI
jgi:signal transduction histidine kinase